MRAEGVGSLLVDASPLGILTDRDLRSRVLAEGLGPETPVAAVMTQPVITLGADASSLDALLLMSERRIRHLPLVEEGAVVGLVAASDLVRAQARDPLSLLRRLEKGGPLPGRSYPDEVREAVVHLAEAGVEACAIGRFVAALNDALVRRVLARVEGELGPAPLPYAFLVYGSDGRREQMLPTDQDNALVWADPEPGAEVKVRAYFEAFADRVVLELMVEGFPACPGGFMANRWRFPLNEAESLLRSYLDAARRENLLEACTLLDFRVAGGELPLDRLEKVRSEAAEAKLFLRLLAADAAEWKLPLGWLGGLREGEAGFDLKRGILLIVSIARLFALAAGEGGGGTLERLEAAKKTLGEADAGTLAEAFRFLTGLRLDEQLGGRAQGSRVRLAALNAMEKRFLKDVFSFLHQLQAALLQHFAL